MLKLSDLDVAAVAAAKLLQSCQTLCDPIDGSPAGSSICGIFQERVLEWVAIASSGPDLQYPPIPGGHSHPGRSEDANTARRSLHVVLGGDAHSQRHPHTAEI